MAPLFSIIIPTYNRAPMIGKAIESVIKQSFENWECIVIDDGSTDETKSVVAKYAQIDSRIRYCYQDNQERSVARNNGIEIGKFWLGCFERLANHYQKSLVWVKESPLIPVEAKNSYYQAKKQDS